MSIDDKWKDFEVLQLEVVATKAKLTRFWSGRLKQAFYAGAKAQRELGEDVMTTEPEHRVPTIQRTISGRAALRADSRSLGSALIRISRAAHENIGKE